MKHLIAALVGLVLVASPVMAEAGHMIFRDDFGRGQNINAKWASFTFLSASVAWSPYDSRDAYINARKHRGFGSVRMWGPGGSEANLWSREIPVSMGKHYRVGAAMTGGKLQVVFLPAGASCAEAAVGVGGPTNGATGPSWSPVRLSAMGGWPVYEFIFTPPSLDFTDGRETVAACLWWFTPYHGTPFDFSMDGVYFEEVD